MKLIAGLALLLAATGTAAADEWYVVLRAGGVSPAAQKADVTRVEAAAEPCHLSVFNDLSDKFIGFAPGYNVFVVGPYGSKRQADRALPVARPCFPGAYTKRGRYLGE